jgi:hypothetical protein
MNYIDSNHLKAFILFLSAKSLKFTKLEIKKYYFQAFRVKPSHELDTLRYQ